MSKVDDLDNIIIEAFLASGIEPTDEAIDKLRRFLAAEIGDEPFDYRLDDELFEVYAPEPRNEALVSQIMATIKYMLARYGEIVDTPHYEDGGLATNSDVVGERGGELYIKFKDPQYIITERTDTLDELLGKLKAVKRGRDQ